jgi:integral membrane sensor domain MASE1
MVKKTALIALSALLYHACAHISYALAIRPAGVVIVWFPAGVTLAALALLNRGSWPFALAGAVIGNVTADVLNGTSFPMSVVGGLTNALESLVAASVLVWLTRSPVALTRVRDVAALVIGSAGISNALTALVGAGAAASGAHRT